MSIQEQMKAKLLDSGIPAKQINVYGSQIVITALSRNTIMRWTTLLSRFASIKAVKESVDYTKENQNTVLRPTTIKVWRVWATI